MKLSKIIILFNLILFYIVNSCTNFAKIEAQSNEDFDPPPEMEFYTFRRESYNTNFKVMDLFATNAKFFNSIKIIELLDTRSYTYQSNGTVAARVSGQFVKIREDTLFTELHTNVVAKASNDTTLFSEYIEWDNQNRLIKSPVPILIEKDDGSWLHGSSMEGDLGLEHITVYNEVDVGNDIGVPIAE